MHFQQILANLNALILKFTLYYSFSFVFIKSDCTFKCNTNVTYIEKHSGD